jgi:hypothetical protein
LLLRSCEEADFDGGEEPVVLLSAIVAFLGASFGFFGKGSGDYLHPCKNEKYRRLILVRKEEGKGMINLQGKILV